MKDVYVRLGVGTAGKSDIPSLYLSTNTDDRIILIIHQKQTNKQTKKLGKKHKPDAAAYGSSLQSRSSRSERSYTTRQASKRSHSLITCTYSQSQRQQTLLRNTATATITGATATIIIPIWDYNQKKKINGTPAPQMVLEKRQHAAAAAQKKTRPILAAATKLRRMTR